MKCILSVAPGTSSTPQPCFRRFRCKLYLWLSFDVGWLVDWLAALRSSFAHEGWIYISVLYVRFHNIEIAILFLAQYFGNPFLRNPVFSFKQWYLHLLKPIFNFSVPKFPTKRSLSKYNISEFIANINLIFLCEPNVLTIVLK